MQEFKKTSKWFKPMSKMMANRFEEAKGPTHAGAGSTTRGDETSVDLSYDEAKGTAVKMRLFGHLTHDDVEWHPHRLVCKRLGILDPYPKSGIVGTVAADGGRGSSQRWGELGFSDSPLHPVELAPSAATLASHPSKPASAAAEATARLFATLGDNPADAVVAPEEPLPDRPAMDIFKAIFSASSSEGEEEEEAEAVGHAEGGSPVQSPMGSTTTTITAPTSAPASAEAFANRFAVAVAPAAVATPVSAAKPLQVVQPGGNGRRSPSALTTTEAGDRKLALYTTAETASTSTSKPPAATVARREAERQRLELVYSHPLAAATAAAASSSLAGRGEDGMEEEEDLWVEISKHNKERVRLLLDAARYWLHCCMPAIDSHMAVQCWSRQLIPPPHLPTSLSPLFPLPIITPSPPPLHPFATRIAGKAQKAQKGKEKEEGFKRQIGQGALWFRLLLAINTTSQRLRTYGALAAGRRAAEDCVGGSQGVRQSSCLGTPQAIEKP